MHTPKKTNIVSQTLNSNKWTSPKFPPPPSQKKREHTHPGGQGALVQQQCNDSRPQGVLQGDDTDQRLDNIQPARVTVGHLVQYHHGQWRLLVTAHQAPACVFKPSSTSKECFLQSLKMHQLNLEHFIEFSLSIADNITIPTVLFTDTHSCKNYWHVSFWTHVLKIFMLIFNCQHHICKNAQTDRDTASQPGNQLARTQHTHTHTHTHACTQTPSLFALFPDLTKYMITK